MPFTYVAFLVGALALVGVPPFSGFFSKDPILANALDAGDLGYALFALAASGAFLTGLYTFRMIFLAFGGEPSEELRARYHPHGGAGRPAVDGRRRRRSSPSSRRSPASSSSPPTGRRSTTSSTRWPSRSSTRRTAWRRSRASSPSALGLAGIAVAWLVYSAKRYPAAAAVGGARAEALLRPAVRRALLPALRGDREGPLRARRGAARRRLADRASAAAPAGWRATSALSRRGSCARTCSPSPPGSPSSSSSSSPWRSADG